MDRFVVVLATNIREILDKAVLDRVAGAPKQETVESSLYGAVTASTEFKHIKQQSSQSFNMFQIQS